MDAKHLHIDRLLTLVWAIGLVVALMTAGERVGLAAAEHAEATELSQAEPSIDADTGTLIPHPE